MTFLIYRVVDETFGTLLLPEKVIRYTMKKQKQKTKTSLYNQHILCFIPNLKVQAFSSYNKK